MNVKYRSRLLLLAFTTLLLPSLQAAVRLPAVISSNMVVLAGDPIALWGWADPGETVTVKLGGTVVANASGQGNGKPWKVTLPAQKPGPLGDIEISGSNTIHLTNILAGEVWLCSGQSNMVQTLRKGPWCPWGGVLDSDKEIAAATDSQIRFIVQGRQSPTGENWRICSPESAPEISGIAYFFARNLRSELKVPVGLIISAVGGTPAELWTPKRSLAGDPDFEALRAKVTALKQELGPKIAEDQKSLAEWKKQVEESKAKGEPPPNKPTMLVSDEQSSTIRNLDPLLGAGGLYDRMILPLVPFNIRGAIWYQGESNALRGEFYARLMKHLIESWREDWGKPFPFAIIALAGFSKPDIWADGLGSFPLVREAQIQVAEKLPGVGVVSAVDVGAAGNIHPPNKQAVGQRAAQWAFKNVYGKPIVAGGPRLAKVDFSPGKAIVSLAGDKEGLVLNGPDGFELAGADRSFFPAKAELKGGSIEVTSPGVNAPVALRYNFLNFPESTIYNGSGLPALPFRSDDWPVTPPPSPK